jgi:hypothetical protein
MTQVIAVDWSGRVKGESEAIWLARVADRQLVELENGFTRDEVIHAVAERAHETPRTVVGLDFAFSFPRWYCRRRGWKTGADVWLAMRSEAEKILQDPKSPFWGRAGSTAQTEGEPLRETDKRSPGAKSVFQIGGAGAVGTSSLRGMEQLARLSGNHGFAIWPFDPPGWPLAIEIYPRALTGPVIKTRHRERRRYLDELFPEQPERLRERAAGSEDSFDAAVSALVMASHVDELEGLPQRVSDAHERLEGEIWLPMGQAAPPLS